MSGDRLRALREAFDASFAAAPAEPGKPARLHLAVRVGGRPYAIPLDAVAGVVRDTRVTPLPSPEPAFLGVAGRSGRPVAVFDLRLLLGAETAPPAGALVLVRAPEPCALAVDGVDGSFAADAVAGTVRHDGLDRPLVDVASALSGLRAVGAPEGDP